jgi:hypothetical protein
MKPACVLLFNLFLCGIWIEVDGRIKASTSRLFFCKLNQSCILLSDVIPSNKQVLSLALVDDFESGKTRPLNLSLISLARPSGYDSNYVSLD